MEPGDMQSIPPPVGGFGWNAAVVAPAPSFGPPMQVPPPPPPPEAGNAAFDPPKLDRPTIRREILVVLLVFPALSTISAIVALVAEIGGHYTGASIFNEIDPAIATGLQVVYTLALCAPFALVWYLLGRSGQSFRSIGLDGTRLVRDIVLGILLMVAAHFLSDWIAQFLFNANVPGVYGRPILPGTNKTYFIVTNIATSIASGVVEEVVVLGYLTNRLRSLRVALPVIAIVSIVLRGSYHVEYGFGVLQPLVFGAMMTAFYLQTRRLLPVIIGHVGYDIWVTLQAASFL